MKKSKIVLVTGGSRGIGRDIVLNLAKKGLNIILTYNTNEVEANKVLEEVNSIGQKGVALQLNVSDVESFDSFIDKLKRVLNSNLDTDNIEFLVNNAGFGVVTPSFAETTEEQFDGLYNVHLKGVFFLTQKLLNVLNDGGGIVNVSSGLTRFTQVGSGAYASIKAAVETLTVYMAKELGIRGIRANVVAPGAIATDFNGGRLRDNEKIQEMIKTVTALNRIGMADDIGGVVGFLCSDDAKWVTGQRIETSGGMYL